VWGRLESGALRALVAKANRPAIAKIGHYSVETLSKF
jgi:hypothetical protein